ncbi:hypothetical protein C2E23DRAFT_172239 [Lenzites betulinus]|nr:hypothetical protein C2E23DRAFT_172239 [Lenzites betulinus]
MERLGRVAMSSSEKDPRFRFVPRPQLLSGHHPRTAARLPRRFIYRSERSPSYILPLRPALSPVQRLSRPAFPALLGRAAVVAAAPTIARCSRSHTPSAPPTIMLATSSAIPPSAVPSHSAADPDPFVLRIAEEKARIRAAATGASAKDHADPLQAQSNGNKQPEMIPPAKA